MLFLQPWKHDQFCWFDSRPKMAMASPVLKLNLLTIGWMALQKDRDLYQQFFVFLCCLTEFIHSNIQCWCWCFHTYLEMMKFWFRVVTNFTNTRMNSEILRRIDYYTHHRLKNWRSTFFFYLCWNQKLVLL